MEEHIKLALEMLADYDPDELGRDYWSRSADADVKWVQDAAIKYGAKAYFGMTKCVIVFPDWDWVVKVRRGGNIDYTTREFQIYERAKVLRVEQALLEVRQIGINKRGISIFIQPCIDKANIFKNLSDKRMQKLIHQARTVKIKVQTDVKKACYGYGSNLTSTWLRLAICMYGKKFMKSFAQLTNDGKINDLHGENVGIYKGRPVLVDYSGYHGLNYLDEGYVINFE